MKKIIRLMKDIFILQVYFGNKIQIKNINYFK